MKVKWLIFLCVLLAGCSTKQSNKNPSWNPQTPVERALQWMPIGEKAGAAWSISPRLIVAIIAVESGGNPNLVSKSNAVGLMQLKAATAGREVYRHLGRSGKPSTRELKNPERNISLGAAYLSILQHGALAGIKDPQVMQYALMIAYVNGAGALLRTFSADRRMAIAKINRLDADGFINYVAKNHPAPQASRYIGKIKKALVMI